MSIIFISGRQKILIYCRHFSVFKIEKFARFSPAILTEVQCLYGNPMSKDNRKRYLSLVPTRSILFRRPRKAWNGRRKPNTILLIKFVACSSLLRSMQSHFQFSIHYVCLYDYDKTESKSAVKFSTKNATERERLQHLEFIKLRKWIFFYFLITAGSRDVLLCYDTAVRWKPTRMSSYSAGQMACGRTAVARLVQVLTRTSVNTEASVLIWWSRPSAIARGLGMMVASANDQVLYINCMGL